MLPWMHDHSQQGRCPKMRLVDPACVFAMHAAPARHSEHKKRDCVLTISVYRPSANVDSSRW